MVKNNIGSIEIVGNGAVIVSEMEGLIAAFINGTAEAMGNRELAEKTIDEIVVNAKKKTASDSVENKSNIMEELFEKIIKDILKED